MTMIVLILNSYSITLPLPSQPAFFMHSNIELDHNLEVTRSNHSGGNYVQHSTNEAPITELYPRYWFKEATIEKAYIRQSFNCQLID